MGNGKYRMTHDYFGTITITSKQIKAINKFLSNYSILGFFNRLSFQHSNISLRFTEKFSNCHSRRGIFQILIFINIFCVAILP